MMGTAAEKIKISKTLIRPVATYGADPWILNKDNAKRLAAFDRKVLRKMFGGIKAHGNWRRYITIAVDMSPLNNPETNTTTNQLRESI
jgi:hypothetical protein